MARLRLATTDDHVLPGEIAKVSIGVIEPKGLLRRPRPARVLAIALSFKEEGQLKPIEISPSRVIAGQQHFHLTKGWVRLEAARSLGWTSLQAVVRRAPAAERRQREVDENLLESGCTVLDRARYLFALKDLYESQHPTAAHGGARRGEAFQVAKSGDLNAAAAPFTAYAAERYGVARRNVERACAIGERLDEKVAEILAETEWGDHQAGLEALSRQEVSVQRAAAALLVRIKDPADTVQAAIAMATGVAPPQASTKAWSAFVGGYGRLGAKERREALREIAKDLPTGVRIIFDDEGAQ